MSERLAETSPTSIARAVKHAAARIGSLVRKTPLDSVDAIGPRLFVKREDLQLTGSFKFRGALNAILALAPAGRRRGIVAASSGNHALGVLHALRLARSTGTIVVPKTIHRTKRVRLLAAGAELVVTGADCTDAEAAARAIAFESGRHYVSPYNDRDVIAGQGTVGLEILDELPDTGTIFVAVGGGGLIAGIAAFVKAKRPRVRVVGCLPRRSPVMSRSVAAGRLLSIDDVPCTETLSDGTAGGIEAGAITFPLCTRLVDEWIEVSEAEIRRALALLLFQARAVVEGAAGVALAGWRRVRQRKSLGNSVVVLCGGNVDPRLVKAVARSPITTA